MARKAFGGARSLWVALLCLTLVGCVRFGFDKKSNAADAGPRSETSQSEAGGDAPPSEMGPGDGSLPDGVLPETGPGDGPLFEGSIQPPPLDENRSSLRFQRRFIEVGGVRQYEGWYDTELDQRCSLRRFMDGTVRCMPHGTTTWSTNTPDDRIFYTDASCTTPLWAMSDETAEPLKCPGTSMSWAHNDMTTCTTGLEMLLAGGFRYDEILFIGVKLTGSHQILYQKGSTGCTVTLPGIDDTLYEMQPIDYKTLPVFSQVRVNHGKRLDSLLWQAADGATIYHASFDTRRNHICQIETTSADGAHCIPAEKIGYHWSFRYADDQCAPPVGSRFTLDCEEPQYFKRQVNAQCGISIWEVFPAGATVTGSYQINGSGGCEQSFDTWSTYYRIEAKSPLSAFAAASSETTGTGRLQQVSLVADGATILDEQLYDSQLHIPCRFARATDGRMRCLPNASSRSIYYTDAACTEAVAFLDCTDSAGAHYVKYTTTAASNSCSITRVHRTLGAMTPSPTEVYRLRDGSCTLRTALPAGTAVELSAELAPGDFVEGVEGME